MSRRAGFVAAAAVVVALLVAVVVAVAAPDRTDDAAAGKPVSYVAVGASDSVGVGTDNPATQAWPVLFLRDGLPKGSTLTNVAVSGSTTAQALEAQVPKAVAAAPDVVTVWLNVNDLRALVEPDTYREQLRQAITALRRGGRTMVLVANTPELDELPAFKSLPIPAQLVENRVDAYNAAIADVVDDTGAVLVDLHRRSETLEAEGRIGALTSADGFHPNPAGYREVARAFEQAYDDAA